MLLQLKTFEKNIEDGAHAFDIYNDKTSTKKVSTKEFAEKVVARLGEKPTKLKVANYKDSDSGSKNFSYEIDNSKKNSIRC